jgi:hypothetical protein
MHDHDANDSSPSTKSGLGASGKPVGGKIGWAFEQSEDRRLSQVDLLLDAFDKITQIDGNRIDLVLELRRAG